MGAVGVMHRFNRASVSPLAMPGRLVRAQFTRGGAGMGGKNPTPKEKKKPKKAKSAKA